MRAAALLTRSIALCLLFTVAAVDEARAGLISGRVVKVIDGDTIDLLLPDRTVKRVRLAGIDCPEKRGGQPFWRAARRALAEQIAGEAVTVEWHKQDRWARLIGVVHSGGKDQNARLVEAGWCWHFKRYQHEQSPEDRRRYAALEVAAREQALGLWAGDWPIAPWEWRAGH